MVSSDYMAEFVNECLDKEDEGVLTRDNVYNVYRKWCQEKGTSVRTKTYLTQQLPTYANFMHASRRTILGKKQYVWVGVKGGTGYSIILTDYKRNGYSVVDKPNKKLVRFFNMTEKKGGIPSPKNGVKTRDSVPLTTTDKNHKNSILEAKNDNTQIFFTKDDLLIVLQECYPELREASDLIDKYGSEVEDFIKELLKQGVILEPKRGRVQFLK